MYPHSILNSPFTLGRNNLFSQSSHECGVESHQPGCNSGCDQNERKVFSGPTQYGARLQTTYLCLELKLKDLWGYIYHGIACKWRHYTVKSFHWHITCRLQLNKLNMLVMCGSSFCPDIPTHGKPGGGMSGIRIEPPIALPGRRWIYAFSFS